MIVDLHAHYPMHVLNDVTPRSAYDQIRQIRGRSGLSLKERMQALVVWGASLFFNDGDLFSGYRIQSPESLRDGGVGVALSVLYEPFEEANLGNPYASPPDPGYSRHAPKEPQEDRGRGREATPARWSGWSTTGPSSTVPLRTVRSPSSTPWRAASASGMVTPARSTPT